jgi:hypothetical protein
MFVYFTAILHNLRQFGICNIWPFGIWKLWPFVKYKLWPLGIHIQFLAIWYMRFVAILVYILYVGLVQFVAIWHTFTVLVSLGQEKSGNPGMDWRHSSSFFLLFPCLSKSGRERNFENRFTT